MASKNKTEVGVDTKKSPGHDTWKHAVEGYHFRLQFRAVVTIQEQDLNTKVLETQESRKFNSLSAIWAQYNKNIGRTS